jgi:hypothetical protein
MLVQRPIHPRLRIRLHVQLHAEGSAKDGDQHGRVAADDRAADGGQYPCAIVARARGEAYL